MSRRTTNVHHQSTAFSPRTSWTGPIALLSVLLLGVLSLGVLSSGKASGQTPLPQVSGKVAIGIEGHYREGCWTAMRLLGEANGNAESSTLIETRDGDGVPVVYQQARPLSSGSWGYAIPGSEAAPLIIRGESKELLSTRFPMLDSPSRGASMIPRKMPWIVAIGNPLGVDKIGANELLDRDASIAVSMPTTAVGFPDSRLGYDGVDMMMIGGSSIEILGSLNEHQRSAISQWITHGGRAFLTLGQTSPELMKAAPWLLDLLPISAEELTTTKLDPSAIETFTSSQSPLREFVGVKLPKRHGRSLITGRTTRRVSAPIAVEYIAGLGMITVVAADLDDEMFAQWPERLGLITRLTDTVLVPPKTDLTVNQRATGYDDLAGQLRATLDQFTIKRSFSFSIVSIILMSLVAAIGPLDYLLVNRLCGRPLLGWLSFPLMAIGLSLILVQQSRPVIAKSDEPDRVFADAYLRCNRMEFIDIDTMTGLGQGFSLNYLYSHPSMRLDVKVEQTAALESVSSRCEPMLITPFGYPGESFGGIRIAIEDVRLPTYRVSVDQTEHPGRGSIKGLPIAPRSSKSIATRFAFDPKLASSVALSRRPGSELLHGSLSNPLPMDLLDGMLIYRNWVYLLPTRFPAGDQITAVEDLRQKNFRWQLTRKKSIEKNRTETETWDPTANDTPERIAEMLMFHDAVGGIRYTSLRHNPLSFLDFTDLLTDDRCILVGRLAQPMTRIATSTPEHPDLSPPGYSLTTIRLVLPIEPSTKR